ncbi:MAG: Hsp20/alpha crystallin family protein [Ginsengibacter sp.]|jgi:HSP20 family protein
MLNTLDYSSTIRSAYPGEYTPNPTISTKINKQINTTDEHAFFSHVNVSQDEEYYLVELDAPGLRREDFIVRINESGNLFITGIHKENASFLNEECNHSKVIYSEFSRELSLPENIDTDFVKAQCRAGMLSIRFLKTHHAQLKRPSFVVVY